MNKKPAGILVVMNTNLEYGTDYAVWIEHDHLTKLLKCCAEFAPTLNYQPFETNGQYEFMVEHLAIVSRIDAEDIELTEEVVEIVGEAWGYALADKRPTFPDESSFDLPVGLLELDISNEQFRLVDKYSDGEWLGYFPWAEIAKELNNYGQPAVQ